MVATFAAAEIGALGPATAHATAPIQTKRLAAFDTIKQIKAGELNIGYAEAGPAGGPPVILLHGWPYDIYSFVDVAPDPSGRRMPRHRPIPAWLRLDYLSFT